MGEKKYLDTNSGATALTLDYNGFMAGLANVARGSTSSERIGDKIVMSSLELNFACFIQNGTPVIGGPLCYELRVIVFLWKDDSGPSVSDIIQSTPSLFSNPICPLNHDKKVKRKLLYDKTFSINLGGYYNGTDVSMTNANVVRREYISLKKLPIGVRTVNYEAGSTAGVNKLYMIALTMNPPLAVGGFEPQFTYACRLNYTDA